VLPLPLLEIARDQGILIPSADPTPAEVESAARWLLSPAARAIPAVRRYLFYLKWMDETFHAVAECFPRDNAGRDGRIDAAAMATSAEEMLYLANHLYLLASHGVDGAVLECGCFKGFSSCCLSHACAALGRELVVADSFAGLPAPDARRGEAGYRAGDFAASLAEVEENVRACGRPERVRFLPGWFAESLAGWSAPLALLWIDVDLFGSTLDVLENVFDALDPRGAIFSHEFLPAHIRDGEIVAETEPPGAFGDFFHRRGVAYRALHLAGWTAIVTLPGSVGLGADRLLPALIGPLRDRDHRARAARQAIGVRNGMRDLWRRTLGRG